MKHPYITPQITNPRSALKLKVLEDEFISKQSKILADQLEIICRNFLDPPIKGEMAIDKLRQRGVKGIVLQQQWIEISPLSFRLSLIFCGIIQRDTLITPTGVKVPYKPNTKDIVCNIPTSTS